MNGILTLFQNILINKNNEGPGIARNYGIKKARGQYLLFLDSDDLWYPEYLETMIGFMEEKKVELKSSFMFFDCAQSNQILKCFGFLILSCIQCFNTKIFKRIILSP